MNQIFLIGKSGRDEEVRTSKAGKPFISFSLATARKVIGPGGQEEWKTTWHRCVCFGKKAMPVRKGDNVFFTGELVETHWKDKQTGEDRKGLEIHGFDMMVRPKDGAVPGASSEPAFEDLPTY